MYRIPDPNMKPIATRSPSLDPGILAPHEKSLGQPGSPGYRGLRAAQKALQTMSDARDRIDALKTEVQANASLSAAAKVALIAGESRRVADEVDETVKRLMKAHTASKIELESALSRTLHNEDFETPVGAARAQEIRSYVASIRKPTDRMTFIRHAAEKGDHQTLSAILIAPAYLSALTDQDHADLRLQAGRALTPDTVNQLEELEKIEAKLRWAANAFAEEHRREAQTPHALAMLKKFTDAELDTLRKQTKTTRPNAA